MSATVRAFGLRALKSGGRRKSFHKIYLNGNAEARYYSAGLAEQELVRRLLMYGYGPNPDGIALPLGHVYGVATGGAVEVVIDGERTHQPYYPDLTNVNVGIAAVIDSGRKTNH